MHNKMTKVGKQFAQNGNPDIPLSINFFCSCFLVDLSAFGALSDLYTKSTRSTAFRSERKVLKRSLGQ